MPFGLDKFNIHATYATDEEIASLKKNNLMSQNGYMFGTKDTFRSLKEILNAPDNTYLQGFWNESYFKDISDVLRKDLTLKDPLSPNAETYKQKILASECSVAMHFRHGDFVYNPAYRKLGRGFAWIPSIERYCDCIKILKPIYKNLAVFVFSNNLPYIKKNLKLDVPVDFIENCAHDVEELYLMSLCKHCIHPGTSTFSYWATWLNQNADKKIFSLYPSDAKTVENWHFVLPPGQKGKSMNILVPFDRENDLYSKVELRPIFSLLLVMNDDATFISDTLDSLLRQCYKYYEVIIIDNASTDGSNKICQQAVAGKANVTYKRLDSKVSNATAWNMAFDMAQGFYVSFLKGGDCFSPNALESLYWITERRIDVSHCYGYLEENENGSITFANKKYSTQRDIQFKAEKRNAIMSTDCQEAVNCLTNKQINSFLGTKVYNREFLKDNDLKFDEQIDDAEAEIAFQKEAFAKSKYFMYVANAVYIAPRK